MMRAKRPNFLYFITDQQRADWLGCAGHPVVKTPNIDRIAENGTSFEDFHVALPVCMPNRASLITGRYPSVHGLRYNGCALTERANTFVEVLAASGYATAAIGKSHLQAFTDAKPLGRKPFEAGPIAEAWKAEQTGYDEEAPGSYEKTEPYKIKTPYYGYQHVEMVTGHGDKCGGHYGQWFRRTHPDWRDLHDPANELPHDYTCPQAYRTPVPEDSYPTAWIGDRAAEWLRDREGDETPFFAFVSFPDPHHPFNPPGKYWSMYDPDDFEVRLPYSAHKNPNPIFEHIRKMWENGETAPLLQTAFYADDRQIREAMALTAGMITMIDDQIGKVMQALEESGHADNTVVIFNSDHGDYMGDFNLLLKGMLQMRGLTRVPFIWSDPSNTDAIAKSGTLASTVDVAATILERAGVKPYWGMQGKSLIPAMAEGGEIRDALLIEHHDSGARYNLEEPARIRTLITKRWRLTIFMNFEWGELYDLVADPDETDNLWSDPRYESVRGRLSERLVREMIAVMEESPRAQRIA
ncbi:sulfatase [Martelella mediterranea]|uniref:Arylsulfatase n=1 Tax=Martelella mediterranea DSM 17316 TaxID=1122214 RepID=A0A1U9Z8B1_9HYPH|nr:sulfatase-like hydrolase/transferase [Martelella mediterranea]AQZ53935.1 Arylsulfatase [Martelella mediterranea DSM 17316]